MIYESKDIKLPDIRNKTSSKRKEYSKLYTNGSKKLSRVCNCGHSVIDHTFGTMMVIRPDCSKCNCKKFNEELQGLTHKGIKRTELLLD